MNKINTILLLSGALLAACHSMSNPPNKPIGDYYGKIYSSGEDQEAKTALTLDGNRIGGDYYFVEEAQKARGTLSKCQRSHRQLVCQWKDKYGQGKLEMTFNQSFNQFTGEWTTAGDDNRYHWSGKRADLKQ